MYTVVNRFRLMQTRLKADMFKIDLHEDGRCETCGIPQDCIHFILYCPDTEILRRNIKIVYPSSKPWTYSNLLSDSGALNILVEYVISNNIQI